MPLHRFREVWVVDYEFRPGCPICLVATELRTKRTIRLWKDQFGTTPPYSVGDDVLVVAFYAPAEMGCHLVLGWELPAHVVDLYSEFRTLTNGLVLPHGNGLLGALAYFRLGSIGAREKDGMRQLILGTDAYTQKQRTEILDYCQSDVDATAMLYEAMRPFFSEAKGTWRARFYVGAI